MCQVVRNGRLQGETVVCAHTEGQICVCAKGSELLIASGSVSM